MALNSPVQIKDGGKTIGYLCADNVGFLAYKANRIFCFDYGKRAFRRNRNRGFNHACAFAFYFDSAFKKGALAGGLHFVSGPDEKKICRLSV